METRSTLMSLHDLLTKTTELKSKVLVGDVSLLNEDLKYIFNNLQAFVQPGELEIGMQIMENGTSILTQKLDEINRFINSLIEKNQILQFLKQIPADEQLLAILKRFWHNPLILPNCSFEFLWDGWNSLVKNKKIHLHREIPPIEGLEFGKHETSTFEVDDSFENQMLDFYDSIKNQLPCEVNQLFSAVKTMEEYFIHFSYFLHLLQKGYLSYDKNSKQINYNEKISEDSK